MRIIPAIDILDGKCVRLTRGNYSTKKVYNEKPLEVAKEIEDNGIQYLHLVDLDGAKSKHIVNYETLKTIASKTNLKIDFGGGVKSNNDIRIAFDCGACQISGGSIAVNNPELFLEWLSIYGNERIILGADCKNRKISFNGWLESIEIDVIDYIKDYEQKGITHVICTDIAKDGMLEGSSNELYSGILSGTNINLIASGGVSSVNDLLQLTNMGCEGAIIGKAIYEGKITLKELKQIC